MLTLAQADQHRAVGLHENALRFYSRALELNRTLVPAWVSQVQMLVQLREYPQATTWSQKALELFPNNSDLLAAQAQAMCRMGDLRQGNALCDAALRQRSESAYQWQVRGELMVAGKQNTDRHCFDRAQILDNRFLVPLESALIYLHHRAYAKAQQRLRTALEKQPDSYYAWFLLGICQEQVGLVDPAIRSLEQCLELCPGHSDAGQRLASLRDSSWSLSHVFRRLFGRH
jgi:tetratricopeptide (TPR) repeat protein